MGLCVCLSVRLSVRPSVSLPVRPVVSPSVRPSGGVPLPGNRPRQPQVGEEGRGAVCLSVCWSVCPSVRPSVNQSIRRCATSRPPTTPTAISPFVSLSVCDFRVMDPVNHKLVRREGGCLSVCLSVCLCLMDRRCIAVPVLMLVYTTNDLNLSCYSVYQDFDVPSTLL